jgi:hypothetical protein
MYLSPLHRFSSSSKTFVRNLTSKMAEESKGTLKGVQVACCVYPLFITLKALLALLCSVSPPQVELAESLSAS